MAPKLVFIFSYWKLVSISHIGNTISGLDFNPNGETVAVIDNNGSCFISDLNTDNDRFHVNLEKTPAFGGIIL